MLCIGLQEWLISGGSCWGRYRPRLESWKNANWKSVRLICRWSRRKRARCWLAANAGRCSEVATLTSGTESTSTALSIASYTFSPPPTQWSFILFFSPCLVISTISGTWSSRWNVVAEMIPFHPASSGFSYFLPIIQSLLWLAFSYRFISSW